MSAGVDNRITTEQLVELLVVECSGPVLNPVYTCAARVPIVERLFYGLMTSSRQMDTRVSQAAKEASTPEQTITRRQ